MTKPIKRKKYSNTAFLDDGFEYREISSIVTELGWKMNFTSIRNYVLRGMRKFAEAYCKKLGINADDKTIDEISRNAAFQDFVGDMLFKSIFGKNRNETRVQKTNAK